MKMHTLVWSYQVDPGQSANFEKEYSRNGSWFKFFEGCDDFLGLELLKSDDGHYLVIDKWISKETYDAYRKANQSEYEQLSNQFKSLYKEEKLLGTYTTVD